MKIRPFIFKKRGLRHKMADVFNKEKRSQIMSLVRSTDTEVEKLAFRYLRKKDIYFQKHYKGTLGHPDIALPSKKKAIFIDGDFWHGRDLERIIKSRGLKDYWTTKIKGNITRDRRQRSALRRNGWKILEVWASDLKRRNTRDSALKLIEQFLISGW